MGSDLADLQNRLEEMHGNFVGTVVRKATHLGLNARKIAAGVHGEMGLKENTVYGKLSPILSRRRWGYHFLPKTYGVRSRKYYDVPRQNQSQIRHTSCLLDHLGVEGNDPLIAQIKELYPGFEYPPQALEQVRVASTENSNFTIEPQNYSDPIVFIRDLVEANGWEFPSTELRPDPEWKYPEDYFMASQIDGGGKECMQLYLVLRGQKPYCNTVKDSNMPRGFHQFLRGDKELRKGSPSFQEMDMNKVTLDSFSRYKKYIVPTLILSRFDTDRINDDLGLLALLPSYRGYEDWGLVHRAYAEDLGSTIMTDNFETHPVGLVKSDRDDYNYVPHVAKMFELYSGISAQQILGNMGVMQTQDQNRIEQIVDPAINMLFTGDERTQIESQIAEARLRMRGNWQSVPRLNLGAIQLPVPGMKDIATDEFVVQATPYVVEYLHQLGIMTPEEAEDAMATRLTNYFVNQAGFQLSRDRAVQIVDSLRENQEQKAEEVAVA